MGLRRALRRMAADRPPVLLVTLAGATEARLAVESGLRARGWPLAGSPGGAAALVVAGVPDERDAEWLGELWGGIPEPKAGAVVARADESERVLKTVSRSLISGAEGPRALPGMAVVAHHTAHDGVHEHDDGGHGHHGAHGDHHAHHGGMVAGLAMAERADDRDGLRLDLLHLPLGPALPDWPSGLVVDVELQGDLVQHSRVRLTPAHTPTPQAFWNEPWLRASRGEPVTRGAAERRRGAAHLDSLGRLLAVAGWADAALRARRLRDAVLSGTPGGDLREDSRRLTRRVQGSRALRWMTGGLGELTVERARESGVTGPALDADGDVHDRLRLWLEEVERSLTEINDPSALTAGDMRGPRGDLGGVRLPSRALLDVLPGVLHGGEFACARLIVASLDPDTDELLGADHG